MDIGQKVISELIKRQIAILGEEITISKVKNVPGIQVDSNGEVISIQGDLQIILANLINQFVELSGMIVKQTMESILAGSVTEMPGIQPQIPAAPPAPTLKDRQILAASSEIENLNKALNTG